MQRVSVVIPSLNNADTISETLTSCLDELEVGEVIVVLAPSTDGTAGIVQGFDDRRVILLEPGVKGIARQMNIGISNAKFEYCCKIDADDVVIKGRFARQVEFLQTHCDYVATAGALVQIDMTGRVLCDPMIRYNAGDVTTLYLSACEVSHLGTLLMRVQAVKNIGGFREWFAMSEDYDLSFRLAELGRIWLSEEPAYGFRVRANSITHSKPLLLSEFYAEAARQFCRQRAISGEDDLSVGRPPPLPNIESLDMAKPYDPRVRTANALETGAWESFNRGEYKKAHFRMMESVKVSPPKLRLKRLKRLTIMTAKTLICQLRFCL